MVGNGLRTGARGSREADGHAHCHRGRATRDRPQGGAGDHPAGARQPRPQAVAKKSTVKVAQNTIGVSSKTTKTWEG